MEFGLSSQNKKVLLDLFDHYLPSGRVLVYGSRAKGHHTLRSDLDVVIQDCSPCDRQMLANLKDAIDESDFPYLIDIQYYETIKNSQLKEHIHRVGKILYSIKSKE